LSLIPDDCFAKFSRCVKTCRMKLILSISYVRELNSTISRKFHHFDRWGFIIRITNEIFDDSTLQNQYHYVLSYTLKEKSWNLTLPSPSNKFINLINLKIASERKRKRKRERERERERERSD